MGKLIARQCDTGLTSESSPIGVIIPVCVGQSKHCPKGAAHTSVGQRPTLVRTRNTRLKALRIIGARMHKAYSLDNRVNPLRRALPYASMLKAFSLIPTFVIARYPEATQKQPLLDCLGVPRNDGAERGAIVMTSLRPLRNLCALCG